VLCLVPAFARVKEISWAVQDIAWLELSFKRKGGMDASGGWCICGLSVAQLWSWIDNIPLSLRAVDTDNVQSGLRS
jgi:hypothetical protein